MKKGDKITVESYTGEHVTATIIKIEPDLVVEYKCGSTKIGATNPKVLTNLKKYKNE